MTVTELPCPRADLFPTARRLNCTSAKRLSHRNPVEFVRLIKWIKLINWYNVFDGMRPIRIRAIY